jgi:hypothetical protein
MHRGVRLLAALAAAMAGAFLVPTLDPSAASAAPAAKTLPTIQVAAAATRPAQVRGETFQRSAEYAVWRGSGTSAFLSGFADANGPFYVNDMLTVSITGADGRTFSWRHDFSNGCRATRPVPMTFFSLNQYLSKGLNTVRFALTDLCGGTEGSSNLYLSGTGVLPPRSLEGVRCNATRWVGGIMGNPVYRSTTLPPTRTTDHRIQGSAAVNVLARVNCNATVRIVLETKVCNRVGWHCTPRIIADSGIQALPDGGVHQRTLTGACRTGTDSYRMRVEVVWATVNGLIEEIKAPVPEIEKHVDSSPDGDGGWVKLSC